MILQFKIIHVKAVFIIIHIMITKKIIKMIKF